MNERIKELANVWANRRAEDEKLGIVYTFSEPALEQFAELIVRGCARVAYEVDGDEGDDYKSGRTWAGIDVLRHFGVE